MVGHPVFFSGRPTRARAPRVPLRSLPALTATGARPSAPGAPLSEQRRTASVRRARVMADRDMVGARTHAAPAPCGTPMAGPPLPSFFALSRAADRARSKTLPTRLVRSLVTDPAPSTAERHLPPHRCLPPL
jgi:hypothetical protein